MTDVPHFTYPFRFAAPQVAVNEQDSLDEIADCVLVTLLYPQGFRVDLPEFGLPDPTFMVPAPDLDEIRLTIETWEPRASMLITETPDRYDELVARVLVNVTVRTEE